MKAELVKLNRHTFIFHRCIFYPPLAAHITSGVVRARFGGGGAVAVAVKRPLP